MLQTGGLEFGLSVTSLTDSAGPQVGGTASGKGLSHPQNFKFIIFLARKHSRENICEQRQLGKKRLLCFWLH